MCRAVAASRAASSSSASVDSPSAAPERVSAAANLRGREARAPSGVLHHEFARPAENRVVHGKRGADGKSGISRSRLNENLFEGRGAENLSVGHAIESHAAGEAQRLLAAFLGEAVPAGDENLFERGLHAGGDVVVALRERLVRLSRRPEKLFESRGK